ncbi:MAG: hypothetical protein H0V30_06030 [Chitinophagaceae bacterium]|nr:hypothetical protein [Chitinophagaceae bacterium]
MAKLTPGIQFTGSIAGLSAYTMKGSDKIILRTKGGLTKKQVSRMPANSLIRLNNREWTGCAQAGGSIRKSLLGILHLADFNITGSLNAMAKMIQKLDTINKQGERSILISQNKHLLNGFSLNRQHIFDSVVRYPLPVTVNRDLAMATIFLPELTPGIHLQMPWPYPMFRFCISMGVVQDRIYVPNFKKYEEANGKDLPYATPLTTAWMTVNQQFSGEQINISLQKSEWLDDSMSIVLGIGLEMGQAVAHNDIREVKYAGCAKVISVF